MPPMPAPPEAPAPKKPKHWLVAVIIGAALMVVAVGAGVTTSGETTPTPVATDPGSQYGQDDIDDALTFLDDQEFCAAADTGLQQGQSYETLEAAFLSGWTEADGSSDWYDFGVRVFAAEWAHCADLGY